MYSSDLKRAFETAQIIGSKCGDLEVITDPDLRERHLDDLQGFVLQEAVGSTCGHNLSICEVHSPSLLYWMLARINVANYYLLETESQDAS